MEAQRQGGTPGEAAISFSDLQPLEWFALGRQYTGLTPTQRAGPLWVEVARQLVLHTLLQQAHAAPQVHVCLPLSTTRAKLVESNSSTAQFEHVQLVWCDARQACAATIDCVMDAGIRMRPSAKHSASSASHKQASRVKQ